MSVQGPTILLKKIGFEYAADFRLINKQPKCEKLPKWKGKSLARGPKVYCFITGRASRPKVRYVGQTTRLARVFGYHRKVKIMRKVRSELQNEVLRGKKVQVWICSDFSKAEVRFIGKSFRLGRLGLEGLLIEHFEPRWNGKKDEIRLSNSPKRKSI